MLTALFAVNFASANYLSAWRQAVLKLQVKLKEDFEWFTLANGSKVHVQG